ncbi:dipeptidase [Clostridium hydrogenum]|uniref:dipeptidase n=1 Tax=Clostridium hydrogenum TaxID=2855764 RepID=UPI001F37D253|nr:membrane dipeptidase [Clostridium hydrogenum]
MIFNAHDDVWTNITRKRQMGRKDILRNYHCQEYKKASAGGGIFVIWQDRVDKKDPKKRAIEIIKNMSIEVAETKDLIQIIRRKDDFNKAREEGKLAVVIGVEGLSFIDNDLELIPVLYMLGVRHCTLTWNEENALAAGINGSPKMGLSKLGEECIHYMEKIGMVLDVSHINEKSFWDICEIVKKPIIASHSNCRKLCDVTRNLYDDQLKAIANTDGVVGLNAYSEFVDMDEKNRTIDRLCDHIDHMVEVMGIDHVGLGFDFFNYFEEENVEEFKSDNTPPIENFEDITKAQNLINCLVKRGYSREDIEKIEHKNFIRVIRKCL